MPFDDWQFYVVSLIAVVGVATVVWRVLPRRDKSECGGCATGKAAQKPKRASLTIEGEKAKGKQ